MKKREITTFETTSNYYIESYINGNISHVKSELSELLICAPELAINVITELPENIKSSVLNSDQFKKSIGFISSSISLMFTKIKNENN